MFKHDVQMKIIKIATVMAVAISCTACTNSSNTPEENVVEPKTQNNFTSQLAIIESAFEKGDTKIACNLQAKLSKDSASSENISSKSIQTLKKFQAQCLRALSSDLKGFLNE